MEPADDQDRRRGRSGGRVPASRTDPEGRGPVGDRPPPSVDRSAVGLGIAALGLLAVAFVFAAWRSSDLDALAIDELPGLVGWLLLAPLAAAVLPSVDGHTRSRADRRSTAVDVDVAPDEGSGAPAGLWVPIVAASLHTVAWSTELAALRTAASLLALGAVGGFLAWWLPPRHRSGPLTVAQLGALVALVAMVGNLALEVVESLVDPISAPAVLDGRGPGLGAVAVAAGMSMVESGLRSPPRPAGDDVAGTFQVLLLGVGWLALLAGSQLDDLGLQATAIGLHLLAVLVLLVRLTPELLNRAGARPWSALGLLAAAAYLGLLLQVVAGFADGRYADATSFPRWLDIAVDLAAYVGLAATGTIGMVAAVGPRRVGAPGALVAIALFVGATATVVVAAAVDAPVAARPAWLAMAGVAAIVATPVLRTGGDLGPWPPRPA